MKLKYLLTFTLLLSFSTFFLFGQEAFSSEQLAKAAAEDDKFYEQIVHMLTLLGMIVGFLLAASWLLKKFLNQKVYQGKSNSLIDLKEKRQLTQRTTLYVLDVGGRGVLLAESQNGNISMVHVPLSDSRDTNFTLDNK